MTDTGVSILLGNGDGTFQEPTTYPTACGPKFVSTGDFNGDQKLDLAVTYSSGSCPYVSIFLGNGDGTFQSTPINTTPLYSPAAIGIGDFNRDGKLDLAVAEQFGTISQVEILLGNGDGTFSAGRVYKVGAEPMSIAVADFRGNGKLDLAVATLADGTDILLGNGDGTFHLSGGSDTPDAVDVIAADLNGDGKVDLAVVTQASPAAGVSVILGNGDGTFQTPTFYPAGNSDVSVAAGDLNGDGKTDLLVADSYPANVYTLLNTGVASFNPTSGINYPFQLVGAASAPQTVTLTNTGTTALTVSSMKTSGPFRETNNCGASVAPGAECAIHVTFKPTAVGSVGGLVTIPDSASSKPQVVELTGAGTVASISPLQLVFGDQQSGTKSAPQPITVKNTGTTPLTISNIVIHAGNGSRDFTETNNCTAQALAAGASCTINVNLRARHDRRAQDYALHHRHRRRQPARHSPQRHRRLAASSARAHPGQPSEPVRSRVASHLARSGSPWLTA